MKHPLRVPAFFSGALIIASTMAVADETAGQSADSLTVNDATIEQCSKQEQPAFARVRKAIRNKQYEQALELLGKPAARFNKKESGEQQYLYGKTLYLLAYQKVNERLADKPDQEQLTQAKKYINLAASHGYAEAIFDQAMLLTPPSDNKQKLRLLDQAARKQFPPAMLTLAEHRFYATKTFEERLEAQALIKRAAEKDSDAKIVLASYFLHENKQLNHLAGYNKDIEKAIEILHSAAMECNGKAAYKLFMMSVSEHRPNSLAAERASYWLEVAARLGYAKAQGELSDYYQTEEQNTDKAIYWASKAAENDDLKALLTLGRIYYQGAGVEKDYSKALGYYEQALAVDKSNRLALNQLGIMYYKGEGSDADFTKAAKYCELAAHKGQAGCQYYLGLMYVNGEGVTQDIDTGISWMKKSAAQDFPVAKNWLRENW